MALETTDRPDKNTLEDLSKVCSEFIEETLRYTAIHAQKEGEKLCEVLTRRSGVLYRQGDVCLWGHATMREYLAARALIRLTEYENCDFQTAIGERTLDSKNYEMLLAFSRNYRDRRELIRWMCKWTRQKTSASAANLVYDVWNESDQSIQHDLQEDLIFALGSSFGDRNARSTLADAIQKVLIEMDNPAVKPLLELLAEYNTLQSRLVPKWVNLRERLDVNSEVKERLYGGYRIRTKIIEILGSIGDERAIEPLIELLPQNNHTDEYSRDISKSVQKALSCIGQPVLASLPIKIKNKSAPIEQRLDFLKGLIAVGVRTEEVSETLGEVLSEGLIGDGKLLADAISAANVLRDKNQTEVIKNSLESDNLEVVAGAASYFSIMPDKFVITLLEKALRKCCAKPDRKNYEVRGAIEQLALAIIKNGNEKSRKVVIEFLENDLRRNEMPHQREAAEFLSRSNLQIAPRLFVRELARQLKSSEPDFIVKDLLDEIARMWQPEQLNELADAADDEVAQIQNENENFIAKLVALGNETQQITENHPDTLSARINEDEIVRTLANCRVPNFAQQIGRLLPKPDFSRSIELCRVLWVAGDTTAEPFLLNKLQELVGRRKSDRESSTDEYYVIRALATCGTKKGGDAVINFIRENPNLSVYLPDEVLRPFVRRDIISKETIGRMALDQNGTHEFVRNFCLQTLGGINVPEFVDIFLDALSNETAEQARAFIAHALGYTNLKRKREVIQRLEAELIETDSAYIASEAGQSLVRLKSKKSLKLLENTISRFGGAEKMSELLYAVAHFRASSTYEFLRDVQDDEQPYLRTDQNIIAAFGEYYETEARAREIVNTRFQTSYKGYYPGRQQTAVSILVKRDSDYLLKHAVEMYDSDTLEKGAKLKIIEFGAAFKKNKKLNQQIFVQLYKRFLCDENLEVREKAGESLNFIGEKLRQLIYEDFGTIQKEWIQGCMIYSFAFWDSNKKEIERARFDSSKIVRHFADAAITIREKREGLKKTSNIFQTAQNSAKRVAAYLALGDQANESHVDELYRTTKREHQIYVFLRNLEEKVLRRVKDERQKREKSEQENFCAKTKQSKF